MAMTFDHATRQYRFHNSDRVIQAEEEDEVLDTLVKFDEGLAAGVFAPLTSAERLEYEHYSKQLMINFSDDMETLARETGDAVAHYERLSSCWSRRSDSN